MCAGLAGNTTTVVWTRSRTNISIYKCSQKWSCTIFFVEFSFKEISFSVCIFVTCCPRALYDYQWKRIASTGPSVEVFQLSPIVLWCKIDHVQCMIYTVCVFLCILRLCDRNRFWTRHHDLNSYTETTDIKSSIISINLQSLIDIKTFKSHLISSTEPSSILASYLWSVRLLCGTVKISKVSCFTEHQTVHTRDKPLAIMRSTLL